MTTKQGLLKAAILKSLNEKPEMNSMEIFQHVTKIPYSYHSDAINHEPSMYSGTIEALRVELVYLRKHGFITKTNKTRLLRYQLTKLGKQRVESPFKQAEFFENRVRIEVNRRLSEMNVPAVTEPAVGSSIAPVQDKQQITVTTAVIEEYSIVDIGGNNEILIDLGDRMISIKTTDGIPEIIDTTPAIGNKSVINTGPNNDIGLNVSDIPGERKVIGFKVVDGTPKFD